jgi:hypothetical protein
MYVYGDVVGNTHHIFINILIRRKFYGKDDRRKT